MDKKEAISVIRNNWPPEQYSMLREALELSIKTLEAVEVAPSASDNSAMVPCSKCGSDSPIVSYCVNCMPKLKVASAQHQ